MVLAACGPAAGTTGGTPGPSPTTDPRPGHIRSATTIAPHMTSIGTVLADDQGYTLYYFIPEQGGKIVCKGICAEEWPPLYASPFGVAAGLGTVARSSGSREVTYSGWPLHVYQGDRPGDTHGQGIEGRWWAATPSLGATPAPTPVPTPPPHGVVITPQASAPTRTSTPGPTPVPTLPVPNCTTHTWRQTFGSTGSSGSTQSAIMPYACAVGSYFFDISADCFCGATLEVLYSIDSSGWQPILGPCVVGGAPGCPTGATFRPVPPGSQNQWFQLEFVWRGLSMSAELQSRIG